MNNNPNSQYRSNLQRRQSNLTEGLEKGDLARLVHTEIHVDEYKSKMGNDSEIAVLSFKVGGKEPAVDLVNFIEKGYDWIIDADTSAGEMEDGDYIVFVEVDRTSRLPKQIIEMLADMDMLTENDPMSYRFCYHKDPTEHQCTEENLRRIIPLTPSDYTMKISNDTDDLDKLKSASGVVVTTKAPKNDYTESLRIAAGII